MLDFVQKVTLAAPEITQADIDTLRAHGFPDAEIIDIAAATAARNFFSKLTDALGAEPDPEYLKLEDHLLRVLAVGRPFGVSGEARS